MDEPIRISRRSALKQAAAIAAAGAAGLGTRRVSAADIAAIESPVEHGRINQCIVQWCFAEYWGIEEMCEIAKALGAPALELIPADYFPILHEHGVSCPIAQIDMGGDPPFLYGFNNPMYHERLIAATNEAIGLAIQYDCPRVICFTGYKYEDPTDPTSRVIGDEEGLENFVEGINQVLPYAEDNGITLCLEQLNTRDDTHDMKGHPGYHGDDIDYCAEICRAVDSPYMKLLFDIYHVQIMNGDIVRRIQEFPDLLGHIHVAGNPGRHELDDTQEINYRACMQALLDVGYEGYVGQEFLATRDPLESLKEAIAVCDV